MTVRKRRTDAILRKAKLSAACQRTGKRRYKTEEAALRIVEDATWWRERGDAQRQERRAYACEWCCGFHVTSLPEPPKARTPLPPVSKKRATEQRQRTRMLRETFGPDPVCARCGKPADDAHELLSRARGGSIIDPANIVPLCRADHRWITEHPAQAQAEGWLRSAGEAS